MSSRIFINEEMDYGQYALWAHNLNRALQGKRGQRALQEMKEALEAMPRKELVADSFIKTGVCALAAVHVYRKQKELDIGWQNAEEKLREELIGPFCVDCSEPWSACACDDPYEDVNSEGMGQKLDIAFTMVWKIIYENDESAPNNPAARWEYMHSWVEARLAGYAVD